MIDIQLEELRNGFKQRSYFINEEGLTTIYLALKLEKPLLISGPTGVGKTELAKALSAILNARLIRLQCYEALDESKALYDWNIQRQLVKIHISHQQGGSQEQEEDLFSLPYILQRPLLEAITQKEQVLLLIDEIDRADPDFESLLLELLSDFQVSIPEIGTIKAICKPVVVITNSGERELTEALRRRCVFLYLDYPTIDEEAAIIQARASDELETLNENIALAVATVRDRGAQLGFASPQLVDWARTILMLNAGRYQKDYVDKLLADLEQYKENCSSLESYTG
ncbi:MAG TPA: MoxR family ATPase [Syntrophaceticus sp.]|nr:MoxR family ATPase [Syntrophaceticus sp.]